jgi:long-chain acyl-CoA synthetase
MHNNRPWINQYDAAVPATISYPEQPLFRFLQEAAAKYPARACTVLDDATVSFREMDEITDRLAAALRSLGVQKGDRVGIFMPNTPQFIMAFYGILKAGAVVVATNPLYMPAEITHQLNDSGVHVMFVMEEFYGTLKSVQPDTGMDRLIVAFLGDALPSSTQGVTSPREANPPRHGTLNRDDLWMRDLLAQAPSPSRPPEMVDADDLALFQYSGGTTGISKAAVARHRGVVANTVQFRAWLHTLKAGQETVLMAIPLYHAYGMIAGMSLGIALGATLALVSNPRDLAATLAIINAHHPTVFPGVPSLYNALNNHPDVIGGKVALSSIRVCISGSTALLRETKERFEQLSGGRICEGYGLSEAPVVTHCNPLLGTNKIGSIGLPMPDVDCKIVNLEDGRTEVPTGAAGELLIHGPQLMDRYHNLPEETSIALRRLADGKVWLSTGDVVRMDSDGYFFIVDRKKELIKPGGLQVWPREVEEALAAHPAVLEVGVAGVRDTDGGEAVKAWIVLKPGRAASPQELQGWCRQKLAAYKAPTMIEFRPDLPKSNVGKILRRELVRQHQATLDGNT